MTIAVCFIGIGSLHLLRAEPFVRIVPPGFPAPRMLVLISGICEIAAGVGLLIRRLRLFAGWGLIALLIAVFPANVFMATSPHRFADWHFSPAQLWLRLFLQPILVVAVWWVSNDAKTDAK